MNFELAGPEAQQALEGDDESRPIDVVDEQSVAVDGAGLRAFVARVLGILAVRRDAAITVLFVDETRIAEMKRDAFGMHRTTDVLSFPVDSMTDPMPGPVVLGDIVLCPAVAGRQARALGRTLDDEIRMLLVHGMLHLLGFDHADVGTERTMARAERVLLRSAS